MKRKTGHIAAVVTPDINSPLSNDFLKPVFMAMPVTHQHDGSGITKQIVSILDQFLADIIQQIQAMSHDGQYLHLNIKKTFIGNKKGF